MAAKIKKGDRVVVLAGKDKGKTGTVEQVIPADSRAVVTGINLVRRHTRQSGAQESGIYTKAAPIHLSNLAIADKNDKPTRVGFRINADGTKVRVAKTTGDVIDG
jgi:large subunit ribosomal protein L24